MTEAIRKPSSPGYAWAIVLVVWLAGFTAPANMAKVVTLVPILMGVFQIDPGLMGWVIGLFYLLGLILAFPAGAMINKLGVRKMVIIALAVAILGGLMGILSGGILGNNLVVFMISRIFEGAGMALMGVTGVVAITPWFAPSKRGLPMGIWTLWVTVAMVLGPIIYAMIQESTGSWEAVWWVALIMDVIIFILFIIIYREPDFTFDENEKRIPITEASIEAQPKAEIWPGLKNPVVWVLGFILCFQSLPFMGIQGFLTTYISTELGTTLTFAGVLTAVAAISGMVFSTAGGWVSDKIRSVKKVLIVGIIGGAIWAWITFGVKDPGLYVFVVILSGTAGGLIPAMIWGALGKAVKQEHMAGAASTVSFVQNIGMLLGAMVLGNAMTALGNWEFAAQVTCFPFYVVAGVLLLIAWRKMP